MLNIKDNKIQIGNFGFIRITENNEISVIDLISICNKQENNKSASYKIWNRLKLVYPKIYSKCKHFKFNGQGQRDTFVMPIDIIPQLLNSIPQPLNTQAVEEIIKTFKINSKSLYFKSLPENLFVLKVIFCIFSEFNPVYEFSVLNKYRIDLYFPENKLAIECDEYDHAHYCKNQEKRRENKISNHLNCKFIRFNPYSKRFNINLLIEQISKCIGCNFSQQFINKEITKVREEKNLSYYGVNLANSLILDYLFNPPKFLNRIADRLEELGDPEGLKRHYNMVEKEINRIEFVEELRKRKCTSKECLNITNGMTKDLFGKSATQIKRENNVKNAREAMNEFELAILGSSEWLAKALMIKNKSEGYKECNEQSRKASQSIKDTVEE